MNGLIEMDAGNPVCLLFILLSLLSSPLLPTSFLSSGLLYRPLFLSEGLGRDVCMRSTQRQCHFFYFQGLFTFLLLPRQVPHQKADLPLPSLMLWPSNQAVPGSQCPGLCPRSYHTRVLHYFWPVVFSSLF